MELLREYRMGGHLSKIYFSGNEVLAQDPEGILVADTNTAKFLNNQADLVLPHGEAHKTWASVEKIFELCLEKHAQRNTMIYSVGGGMLCDIVGLAASLYLRGMRLCLIPSTLLSMVDASVGGKTSCNFHSHKNYIGSFYPAHEVHLRFDLLQGLPEPEWQSGLGEIIKMGMLSQDQGFFDGLWSAKDEILKLKSMDKIGSDSNLLRFLILYSLDTKVELIGDDLTDRGKRQFLNLGHTFAHAFETLCNFSIPHGQIVAWGLYCASKLSHILGYADKSYPEEVENLLRAYGFDLDLHQRYPVEDLLELMNADKKRKSDKIQFVLQRRRGNNVMHEISKEEFPLEVFPR